jgi:hypothetical protein
MNNETGKSKITKIIIITGVTIIGIGVLCGICSIASQTAPSVRTEQLEEEMTPEPTKDLRTYQKVYEIKGNGAKNTEFFTITGEKFRVRYDCKISGQYGGVCQAYLLDETGDLRELLFNSTQSEVSETVITGAGKYQIKFNTISANYSVQVEDYR